MLPYRLYTVVGLAPWLQSQHRPVKLFFSCPSDTPADYPYSCVDLVTGHCNSMHVLGDMHTCCAYAHTHKRMPTYRYAMQIHRVGQNRISAPYMTVCMVIPPAKNTVCTPYIPINVWFWPTLQIHRQKSHTSKVSPTFSSPMCLLILPVGYTCVCVCACVCVSGSFRGFEKTSICLNQTTLVRDALSLFF